MQRETIRAAWRRAQEGWPRRYPVVQFPNPPLLVALGASVGRRLTDGDTAAAFDAVGRVALAIWAWEELAHGDNAFRRVLGAGGLAVVVVGLAGDL